jgi:hypothetical protein
MQTLAKLARRADSCVIMYQSCSADLRGADGKWRKTTTNRERTRERPDFSQHTIRIAQES